MLRIQSELIDGTDNLIPFSQAVTRFGSAGPGADYARGMKKVVDDADEALRIILTHQAMMINN